MSIDPRFGFITRSSCPACGGTEIPPIYQLPPSSPVLFTYLEDFYRAQGGIDLQSLKNWEYILCECKSCKLVFQQVILNDYGMYVLYEQWLNPTITFEESKKHDASYYLNLVEEVRQAVAYFGKKPYETKVMDFGMGWAEWCKVASALGCDVTGAELSDARIHNATRHGIPVINIDNAKANEFDFINTEQVFEHIPNPLETLKKLTTIVKPRGMIKISVPDCIRIYELLKINDWRAPKGSINSLNIIAPLEHINSFTFGSLVNMAKLAGLTLVPELAYRKYPNSTKDVVKNDYRHFYFKNLRKNKGTYLFFQKPR